MAPLDVDPEKLAAAGVSLAGHGDAVAQLLSALASALSGVMCGHDPAAVMFGASYDTDGKALLKAAASVINACRRVGFGIQMSAANYAQSEAASTVGGAHPDVPVPAEPAKAPTPGMPSPFGSGIAAPALWMLVEEFVGFVWPDGDPASMRAGAQAWKAFGQGLGGIKVADSKTPVTGQQIPEQEQITTAIDQVNTGVTTLAAQSKKIGETLETFAGEVERAQNAIRDLLHRLSPSGILNTLGGIFTGHNPLDDIKAVAEDIKAVLSNMRREAKACEQALQSGPEILGGAADSLENWITKEFTHYLGDDVGGTVATAVNGYIDIELGVVDSVIDTVSGIDALTTHAFVDPEGTLENWGHLALTLGSLTTVGMMIDPERSLDTVKGLVDFKDWTSDHPLRGLGHNIGDIAQLFIPGVGEAKPATTGAEVAARTGEAGRVSSVVREAATGLRLGGTDIASEGGRLASNLDRVGVPKVEHPPTGVEPKPPTSATEPVRPATPPGGEPPRAAPGATDPANPPGIPRADSQPGPTPGEQTHPPGEQTHPPGEQTHPPGEQTHPPGEQTHPPGEQTHPPGEQTHGPAPEHHGSEPSSTPDSPGGHEHQPLQPVSADAPPPSALPHDSPMFDGYNPVDPGPHFTNPDGSLHYPNDLDPAQPYAVPGSVVPNVQIPPGTILDRFGYPGGGWMSPEGVPFAERALPPESAAKPYYHYEVMDTSRLPPGWRIEQSEAAPWFHQPGGGTQYRIVRPDGQTGSIEDLIGFKVVREVR